ncbi:hypothetical protein ES332_A13G202800v1 [Gossypium tomentosum]|uniref:Uncharacterized protein n=1 Tax=Gossypium tomentosum TaxID=34277 RepID=A0A5D2MNA2_GOSTO|nr:hypothetical protein ES332_A13G202800v1 [Gossypium tomentosum]
MGQPTSNGAVPMGSNIPKPYYFVCGSFEPKSEGEKRGFPLFPSQGHRSPIVAAPPSPNAHRGGRRARYLGGVGAWHGVAHDSEAWRASYAAWTRSLRRRFPSAAGVLGWLYVLCIGLRDVG